MKKSYNQSSNTNVFARKHKIMKPSTFLFFTQIYRFIWWCQQQKILKSDFCQ